MKHTTGLRRIGGARCVHFVAFFGECAADRLPDRRKYGIISLNQPERKDILCLVQPFWWAKMPPTTDPP